MNKVISVTVILSFLTCLHSLAQSERSGEFMVKEQIVQDASLHDDMSTKNMGVGASFNHSAWTNLLKAYVKKAPGTTQVDYQAISKKESSLQSYLDSLSKIQQNEFDAWTTEDQLAFLLNAYNAWTVKLILSDLDNIESIKDLGNFILTPWKKKFVPLFGETVSLDHIEHTLIRGSDRYNDPRIHFAANCASVGCPALRQEAYEGHKLENQLEEQTRLFLSDPSRNNAEGKTLNISSIFKWYRGDFEAGWRESYTLQEFLYLYKDALSLNEEQASALELDDMKENFLSYDWDLNKTP